MLPEMSSVVSGTCSSWTYSTGSSYSNSSPGTTQRKDKHTMNNHSWQEHVLYARLTRMHNKNGLHGVMGLSERRGSGQREGNGGVMKDVGRILVTQACHWKDWKISVEIDMKITGDGCTVCKWRAKQDVMQYAYNSNMATLMQSLNMLQHPNMNTNYMAVKYKWSSTNHEHWATARTY